jgi:undecaprenyl-diphosphatase
MGSLVVVTAKYGLVLSVVITLYVWVRLSRPQKVELTIWAVLGGVVAVALVELGGALYFDPRPFVTHHVTPLFAHATDTGFPSDHTAISMFLAVCVLFYSRRWGAVLVGVTLLVGASRVAAHVHSPFDILGGVLVGAAAALATLPAARSLAWRRTLAGTRWQDTQCAAHPERGGGDDGCSTTR